MRICRQRYQVSSDARQAPARSVNTFLEKQLLPALGALKRRVLQRSLTVNFSKVRTTAVAGPVRSQYHLHATRVQEELCRRADKRTIQQLCHKRSLGC